MNKLLSNPIVMIAGGIAIGFLINILKKVIKVIITKGNEPFSFKKLITGFSSKSLGVILIFLTCFYGYAYWRGQQSKPADFSMSYEKEIIVIIPDGARTFSKPKDSSKAYWIYSNGKKEEVKQGDIEQISEYLKPYGFILQPVGVIGYGFSNVSSEKEVGVGLRYVKCFKYLADISITSKGIYPIGVSYRISDNSAIGISAGTGYKEGERGLLERIMTKYTFRW